MPLHTVSPHPEKNIQVAVTQTRKTVWTATGEFMGEHLSVKGSSERNALNKWVEVAEFRYRTD